MVAWQAGNEVESAENDPKLVREGRGFSSCTAPSSYAVSVFRREGMRGNVEGITVVDIQAREYMSGVSMLIYEQM